MSVDGDNKKICIIGAGSSGIAAAKVLAEAQIPFDCFEMGSDIGGNWRQNNDNGRSAAYDSLHIDTSKRRMAFSDFPMPAEFPQYPHHSQVLEYFEAYAEHFDLKPRITFRTKVDRVAAAENGDWEVTTISRDTDAVKTETYRAVLVCNGHHWCPKVPDLPGEFNGQALHSRRYRSAHEWRDLNVLVVGIGNSGTDIVCDVAHVARRTLLSTRRSAHIIPRYILGRPTDNWVTPFGSRLPLAVQRWLYGGLVYLTRGDQERYGVARPPTKLLSEHPTLSSDLLTLVASGDIEMKPNIERLAGDRVRFTDGSEEEVDVVVLATGYKIDFPFFEPEFLAARDNDLSLFGMVIHPDHQGLYFVGLIQPLGAIMPLAELQSKWVAGLLAGELRLPDKTTMRRSMEKKKEGLRKRYVHSTRHTIQVDFFPYKRFLERELRRR